MKIFALSFFAFTVAAMAQVKVSDLPAASTLGGTEVFPTVQSATTKKATAAQIAEYARSVAASTLAPIASPTFTGTVTIPSGASIADYLSTASAATIYAPLASPVFTGTPTVPGYLTTASAAATYAPLANPTFSGVLTMSGGSNAVRVDVAGVYAGLVQNGINTNKNGFIYTLRFPTTVTGNYTVTLPDGANGTLAMQSGALGTPSSVTLTNATGLPIASGISGLGTGIATALAVNVGSAGAPVVNGGALGTPSSGTGTNITGIPPANVTGTAAVLGANTFPGAQIISVNGANSTPPMIINGTIFTGGTSTTTKPQFLIEPTGTTSTGWFTSGTAIGVNIPSGSTSYFAVFQQNGSPKASISSSGVFGSGSGDHGLRIDGAGTAFLGSNHTPNTGPYVAVGYNLSPIGPVVLTAYGQASYGYTGSSSPDLWTSRRGAAHMGMGIPSATPITQTFGAAEASGTNITGGTLNLGTRGTGTGTGGTVNLQSHAAGSSGSTLGTLVTIASAGPSGFTIGASGTAIASVLSAVATKDFDLTAVVVEDLTMTVTGAAVGDVVSLGVPTGSTTTTSQFSAWVSAADTVTIRCRVAAAGENPASGSFRATVIKH